MNLARGVQQLVLPSFKLTHIQQFICSQLLRSALSQNTEPRDQTDSQVGAIYFMMQDSQVEVHGHRILLWSHTTSHWG